MNFVSFLEIVLFAVVLSIVNAQKIPKSSFSCDGRTSGYYADVSTGCQVYHMCDGLGRQFSYKCPSKTLFQQRMLICDHWYMVNCSKAEEDYSANLLIGQRQRAFVEDPQFRRTPRPDLIDPGNSEYNTYRIGEQETLATKNVVGADEDEDTNTDETSYFPPSHWSTEASIESTTKTMFQKDISNENQAPGIVKQIYPKSPHNKDNKQLNSNFQTTEKHAVFNINGSAAVGRSLETKEDISPGFVKQIFYKTNYNTISRTVDQARGKELNFNSVNRKGNTLGSNLPKDNFDKSENVFKKVQQNQVPFENDNRRQENNFANKVNFPSNFEATTPVYPKHVDIDSSKFNDFEDPLQEGLVNRIPVNFPSNFKATTPVYPKYVETDPSKLSEFDIPIEQKPVENVFVNFPSNFKATTPVYPLHVDIDPSKLSEFDILPSDEENAVSVNFPSKFKATTPVYPAYVDINPSKLSEFDIPIDQEKADLGTINFPSKFKATTPVYPAHVDIDPSKLSKFDIPIEQEKADLPSVNFPSKFKATTPSYPKQVDVDLSKFSEPVELPLEETIINFPSNNTATTPVYPNTVESTSPNPDEVGLLPPFVQSSSQTDNKRAENVHVNFASNFQATTPNYPTSVEPTSPDPSEVGLAVPKENDAEVQVPSSEIKPPNFEQTFSRRSDEYDPIVIGNTFNSRQLTEFMLTMKPEQLKDLKELWHIPDYDFPLDTPASPSYASDFSSFQAKPLSKS